jgi:hypothetical protein
MDANGLYDSRYNMIALLRSTTGNSVVADPVVEASVVQFLQDNSGRQPQSYFTR